MEAVVSRFTRVRIETRAPSVAIMPGRSPASRGCGSKLCVAGPGLETVECLPLHAGADRNHDHALSRRLELLSPASRGCGSKPLLAPGRLRRQQVSRFTRVRIEIAEGGGRARRHRRLPLHAGADRNPPKPPKGPPHARSPASRGCGSKRILLALLAVASGVSRFTRVRIETGHNRNRCGRRHVSRFTRVRIETEANRNEDQSPGGLPLHAGADRNPSGRLRRRLAGTSPASRGCGSKPPHMIGDTEKSSLPLHAGADRNSRRLRLPTLQDCLPLHAGADRNTLSSVSRNWSQRLPLHAGADRNNYPTFNSAAKARLPLHAGADRNS